jgi:type VII secretion protein EccE
MDAVPRAVSPEVAVNADSGGATGPAATALGQPALGRPASQGTVTGQAALPVAPAAPVRIAAATGLAVAAARHAPVRKPPAAAQARPLEMPRTPPVRPPDNPAAAAPPRVVVRRRRGKGFVTHLRLVQVICWQIAVLAVVLTVRQPWPVLVCAWVGAAALIALTAVRIDGLWLYERAVLAGDYLARKRRRDLPGGAGRTPALLSMLVPGCTVRDIETSHGPAMTLSHRGGLTAVLQPNGGAPDLVTLPTPAALLPHGDGQMCPWGVQTVYHAGVRRDGPTRVWLAVRAARDADAPGDDELTLFLRNAVRRVRHALGRAGVPAEPLAEQAALAAIAGLAHVTGGRHEVREEWRFWRTGPVCQTTVRMQGWHRLGDWQANRLVADLLAVIADVAVTVTIAASSGPHGPQLAGVLRLAATTEAAVEAALAAMRARATAYGVRLARLDGTHSRGVAASLPIGVFLP